MSELQYVTKGNASPKDKPKAYFTCHPEDFDKYFKQICEDIFKTYDCTIFYTEDMSVQLDNENRDLDLYQMNLFVMPVTFRLLTEPNRAMDEDYVFADEKHIPVLPLMMESNIDEFYTRRFGERQYICVYENDPTKKSYSEQLSSYLRTIFLDKVTVERIRKAFDAYIFLSYRKKDRRYANELMQMIHSHPELEKLAIWYDEFLTPGESFMENIRKIMTDSKLFSLLVTPSLLEKPNFVMEHEYPAAKGSDKPILPAQAVATDAEQLKKDYDDIPEAIDMRDESVFEKQYIDVLRQYAVTENRDDPEHIFLIGLAYLDGIDVEVDKDHGVRMVIAAAEADYPEAMFKLRGMYETGLHVKLDYFEALKWAEKLYHYYLDVNGENSKETLFALNYVALLNRKAGFYSKCLELSLKYYHQIQLLVGEKHNETLKALNNLSVAYSYNGKFQESLTASKKCYELICETQAENHRAILITLMNLALSYDSIGDYQNYLELAMKCYQLSSEFYGETSHVTLTCMGNMAVAYGRVGNFEKELELTKQCYQSM